MKIRLSELTLLGAVLRIIRRIKLLDKLSQYIIVNLISNESRREKFNLFHNQLSFDEKGVFHTVFYKTFRKNEKKVPEGIWTTDFLGEKIKLPLRSKMIWLDWEHASAILGHDIDVKETYETFLKSDSRPNVFFDVGANYGMHTLLFLKHGVQCVAFEPNPNCKKEFDVYCKLNNLNGKMENVAVGDREGVVDLWFPEKETWLGTIVEKTMLEHLHTKDLTKIQVPLIMLDKYVELSGTFPNLIKIDAEGNELNVIKGAEETIRIAKPLIIFECNAINDKNKLWEAFQNLEYEISAMPILNNKQTKTLDINEFLSSNDFNFLASPKGN